jgi:hypothetical protein
MDITKNIIGKEGIVKDEYLNENEFDHHLSARKTFDLWLKELDKVI